MSSWKSRSANPMTPKPDLPGGPGGLIDFRRRVLVHLDDIVEEPDSQFDDSSKSVPVDLVCGRSRREGTTKGGKVDRSETAGLAGKAAALHTGWSREWDRAEASDCGG